MRRASSRRLDVVTHRVQTVARLGHRADPVATHTPLTGTFDTGQLPRIAAEPVTVTVARRIAPGREAQFLKWADELIDTVKDTPGCLGAAVLHPGDAGGEYQIVVRFVDGLSLRRWERSDVRNELMERADEFVTSVRLQRTVGVEEWFQAAGNAAPPRPHWQRVLFDVAWVYPVSLGMSVFVSPYLARLAVWERVGLGATLITIAMTIAVGPFRRWLRRRRRL
jgi:antibiotic biosynthesis monooxygenase (ABM) superfamily enzyme